MKPDYKALSRGYSADMSSAAIADRLDKVGQLYDLWVHLQQAQPVGTDETSQRRESTTDGKTQT